MGARRILGLYLVAVGLLAMAGCVLGLSVRPFAPNPDGRPPILYVMLLPYYLLQEAFAYAAGTLTAAGAVPETFNLAYTLINYLPAAILIAVGWLLWRSGGSG
jgi:hypothetical protein